MSSSHEPQQEQYYEMKGGFNQSEQATDEKRGSVDEGAELYGDIQVRVLCKGSLGLATDLAQTAEHYGYVQRGLKSRHIQFIAVCILIHECQ